MVSQCGHRLVVAALACVAIAAAWPAAPAKPGPQAASQAAPRLQGDSASPAAPKIDSAARREDWRWLDRFPDEATHRNAERAELQAVIERLRQPNERLAHLIEERKPLDREAEFHQGKPLPADLQRKIDANDASFTALTDVFRLLRQDVAFIVAKYGAERGHLRRLWGGAPPGSIGFFVPVSSPAR